MFKKPGFWIWFLGYLAGDIIGLTYHKGQDGWLRALTIIGIVFVSRMASILLIEDKHDL